MAVPPSNSNLIEQPTAVSSSRPNSASSSAKPDYNAIGNRLREFERAFDILQYRVDGWCIWPLFRSAVANTLAGANFSHSRRLRLRDQLAIALGDLPRFLFPGRPRGLVLSYASGLCEWEGGRVKDIYFDDVLRDRGDCFKLEIVDTAEQDLLRRNALIRARGTNALPDLVASRLLLRLPAPAEIGAIAESMSAALRQGLQLEKFTARGIANACRLFYWKKRFYSLWLRRTKPRALFVICGYANHEIMAAAKELNIEVCEYQHGVFSRGSVEYGWSCYAKSYKAHMPLPDKIFVYGKYWEEVLAGEEFWSGDVVRVGSLKLDRYRQETPPKDPTSRAGRIRVLVTTQGIEREGVIRFIREFLELCRDRPAISVCFKLHPGYEDDKSPYARAFGDDSRVQILLGGEAPSTMQLLSESDLHVSVSSNCHFDALGLGVPTAILPFFGHELVLDLCKGGYAFLARSPEALVQIMDTQARTRVPRQVAEYYFEPHAIGHLRAEFDRRLSGR